MGTTDAMSFPAIRMRRMRRDAFSRALMRENTLLPSDLIMVAFVIEGEGKREPVPSMPGVERLSIDELLKLAANACGSAFPRWRCFLRRCIGEKRRRAEAWNPGWPDAARHPRAEGEISRARFDRRRGARSVHHARAGRPDRRTRLRDERADRRGADQDVAGAGRSRHGFRRAVGHDGRPHRRHSRRARRRRHIHTRILAYSAKYASAFYGPFRDAVGSSANLGKGNKHTYQMDVGNSDEACAKSSSTSPKAPTR
jgi:porphobilinogen synthase